MGLLLTNVNTENAPMGLCSFESFFVFGVSRRSSMFSLLHAMLDTQRLAIVRSVDDTRAAATISARAVQLSMTPTVEGFHSY